MKSVTIRQLRHSWPQTEKTLQSEHELIITRDGRPVARLTRIPAPKSSRARWNPDAHRKWLAKLWGGKQVALVDKYLKEDRDEQSGKGV